MNKSNKVLQLGSILVINSFYKTIEDKNVNEIIKYLFSIITESDLI